MRLISPDLREDIYDIFYSIKECIIRFFNNRFVTTNETIEFLKLELDKERLEKQKLQNYILEMNSPKVPIEDTQEFKPIVGHVPFSVMQRRLEQEDRNRARELRMQRDIKLESNKTTEELEQELLS